MGTGLDVRLEAGEVGVVPRAVATLFAGIADAKADSPGFPPSFRISVQFIEVFFPFPSCAP